MFDYDTESRLQLAREHVDRLADDMRRTRRLTADAAGYPVRPRFRELVGRVARVGRRNEAEPTVPAYDS
jgi:hypothetical protein